MDKKGLLRGAAIPYREVPEGEQVERLRRQIAWFWHDLSHFITAMGRGQLFWAAGQLEELHRYCLNLALLRRDFTAKPESFEKVDAVLAAEDLTPLMSTYPPLEREAMLWAARTILQYYRELAQPLAQAHGLDYPAALERVMVGRMEKLG